MSVNHYNFDMPRKKFWDDEGQKVKAHSFAKRNGLDYSNQQIKETLREMYRSKYKHFKMAIPDQIAKQHKKDHRPSNPITNTMTKVLNIKPKIKSNKQLSKSDQYPMTNKKWHGDYFSWYKNFILPTYVNGYPLGKLHKEWCDEIESDDYVLMLKPRDHYKTSICSVGYAIYNLCERKLFPVLVVSKADLNTKDTFLAIREHLQKNQLILDYYGYIIDEDRPLTAQMLFTRYQTVGMRDPGLYCGTFGSKIVMGTHPFLAILDDIEDEPLTISMMRQAKNLLDKSLISGLPVGARLILVGTIKGWDHTNDIYLYAEKKGIFSVYRDPAVYLIEPITQRPILDKLGKKIYGMPENSQITWEKKRIPAIDRHSKRPMLKADGTPKTIFSIFVSVKNQADLNWKSIYPERYTVKDIIRKRIATREVDKESDDTFWSEFFLEARDPKGNFFDKGRVGFMPPPNFATLQTFVEYAKTRHWPIYLWVDPGGKGSHGIAIAVVCIWNNITYVLDMVVSKAGIPITAKIIGDLIIEWNVTTWGCESNYTQKETFGDQLELHLRNYLKSIGKSNLYLNNNGRKNTGDKILRIQTHLTAAMGIEGSPISFFINQNSAGYELFEKEFSRFPESPSRLNEFDILDCIASIRIHLSRIGLKLACVGR